MTKDGRNRNPKQLQQTIIQLDVFHTLWNLYNPHQSQIQPTPSRKRAQPLPREDALRLFPTGTTVAKESGSEIIRGQVCDYRAPYWRVQYEDDDWEELLRQQVHRMAGVHQGDT